MGSICNSKVILLILICSVSLITNAQIIYEEGFEDGAPGWLYYDADKDGNNFEITEGFPHSGKNSLISWSTEFDISTNSYVSLSPVNYAISPVITLPSSPPINLSYAHSAFIYTNYDKEFYEVRVVIADSVPDLDSLIQQLDSLPSAIDSASVLYSKNLDGVNNYEVVEHDISNYIGEKVRLVFKHHFSVGQFLMSLDDVRVAEEIDFDVALQNVGYENDYRYGHTPSFLLDSIPIYVDVANHGTRSFSGVHIEVEGSGNAGNLNFLSTGKLEARIDPGEVWRWRGKAGVDMPDSGYAIPVMRATIKIDSPEVILNNNEYFDTVGNVPLIQSLANLSGKHYSIIDTHAFFDTYWGADTFGTSALEEFLNPNPTGIFYDPNDPDLNIVGDRFTEIDDTLTLDPSTGNENKAIVYGVKYDFERGKENFQVELNTVRAVVAPVQAGADSWVEVYDYYNFTNTVGDSIIPIWVSDTMRVPFGYDDGFAHTLKFDFKDSLAPVFSNGSYIVAVVESGHKSDNSIGLLGIRSQRYILSGEPEKTSFLVVRGSNDENIYTVDPDQLIYFGSEYINYAWPISIDVTKVSLTGQKEVFIPPQVLVYPNPFHGKIGVKIASGFRAQKIRVLDLTGRMIHEHHMNKANGLATFLYLDHLDKGVYFLEVQNEMEKVLRKIVKN